MRTDEMEIKNDKERKYDWRERWIDARQWQEGEIHVCSDVKDTT